MPNTCTIPVMTGSNKGKLCKDINRYCRHKKTICDICKEEFSHKSSYERHRRLAHISKKKKVCVVKKPEPMIKMKVGIEDPDAGLGPGLGLDLDPDTQRVIQRERERVDDLVKELSELREKYETVSKRMGRVEREPKNITVVIGDEKIFHGLVKKLGDELRASKFLLENIAKKNCINIVDKLYLEGVEKDRYPIACADDYQFRYLNGSGDIVDDTGGKIILTKLQNEVHSALIEANTCMINEQLGNSDDGQGGSGSGSVGTLYDVYDLGHIQHQLGNYRGEEETEKLRDDLARRVYNVSHPFFS